MIVLEKNEIRSAIKNGLARNIRELRTRLELTQEQFATRLGVTFSTVNRWESGKSKPSPLAMRQINELREQTEGNKQ